MQPMLTFPGYRRSDGRVGVRNHLLVLPTSELLNRVSELVEAQAPDAVCITHFNASGGGDADFHLRVMTGFATNPNVGHVILLGLGDPSDIGPRLRDEIAARGLGVELHTLYESGGVPALAERVAARAREIAGPLGDAPRAECPVSELI